MSTPLEAGDKLLSVKKIDLTRILLCLKQARHLLEAGRQIAAKAHDKPLETRLSERVAVMDSDIQHVGFQRDEMP